MGDPKAPIFVENERGTIDGVDPETGEVVLPGKDAKRHKHRRKNRVRVKRNVRLEDGRLKAVCEFPVVDIPPSPAMKKHILDRYASGMTWAEACTGENLPGQRLVSRWLINDYPSKRHKASDFREAKAAARQLYKAIKAEAAHDRVIELAEDVDEDNAQARRVQIDAHKWAAKVNDPANYGDKTQISGDANAPISFVIDTGIRREEPIEIDTKKGSGE